MFIAVSLIFAVYACCTSAAVVHYPPNASTTNNLTFALTGTGAPGIYTSSDTPNERYGTYNWCNMPHVRPREYKYPGREYTLEYVEVIQRHHKRTPYASNTFFKESVSWSCDGEGPMYGVRTQRGRGSEITQVQWQASTNPINPWTSTVGPGFAGSSCQFPQITGEGLEDAITHGRDLRQVYAFQLGLSPQLDPRKVQIRVTNNVITSQVASGLIRGLFPFTTNAAALIQSSTFDSLEPTYSCPKASSLKADYTTGGNGQAWNDHLELAKPVHAQLDRISGVEQGDGAGWHVSFDHYYDNMSAKQCHGKSLPCNVNATSACVSQDLANTVYRLGNWEYSYLYRDAPNSASYAALRYGVWVLELKGHLQAKVNGSSQMKYVHNIAHDGSIAPLLGFLQVADMVWPGMGSEIVFELYSKQHQPHNYYMRVLWGGQPMKTSTPMGVLDMVPLDTFFAYVDEMVGTGADLYMSCNAP